MKLAAIDIGSNAVRMQITKALEYEHIVTFKKLEYVRFPLRLGRDVFTTGSISDYNRERFHKLMTAFKNLIDLYEVDALMGCATSAMRESENGRAIVSSINEELDLSIRIISGEEEADMINKVIVLGLDRGKYIHIDVGGGSTELNIYENQQKTLSSSHKIGSVRLLENTVSDKTWGDLSNWVKGYVGKEKITAIGTGGNINKMYELSQAKSRTERKMALQDLMRTLDVLDNLSLEDRLNKLQLNPDRADVIIPASKIYIEVMKAARSKNILVPDVGLKDGINLELYERQNPMHDKVLVRN